MDPVLYHANEMQKRYFYKKGVVGAIDPILILAIISTIVQIIRLIVQCRQKNEDKIIDILRHPSIWQKWQFNRVLKKAMKEYNLTKEQCQNVRNILWEEKNTITQAEFMNMYHSIKNQS